MDIFRFFGEILSEQINKPPTPSAGLIRLGFKADFPGKDPQTMTYDDLLFVFKNGLKKKLEFLNMDNINGIVNHMVKQLNLNQSILTISK